MAINALAEAVRQGKEVFTAELSISTASGTVTTPFRIIDGVFVTRKSSTSPGTGSSVFTWEVSGSVVTVYAWRPTSTTDTTLVAGNSASTVSVIVVGRRR